MLTCKEIVKFEYAQNRNEEQLLGCNVHKNLDERETRIASSDIESVRLLYVARFLERHFLRTQAQARSRDQKTYLEDGDRGKAWLGCPDPQVGLKLPVYTDGDRCWVPIMNCKCTRMRLFDVVGIRMRPLGRGEHLGCHGSKVPHAIYCSSAVWHAVDDRLFT
jgi:hypothetical protein